MQAPGWSFTVRCQHEGEVSFDFNRFREHGRDDLAGHMRDALWSMRNERVGRSLMSYDTHGLRYFWRFLDELHTLGEAVTHLCQIDRGLLDRYLVWLELQLSSRGPTKGQPLSLMAKKVSFNHLKALLVNRCRFAPTAVSSELSFPRNAFPYTNKRVPRRQPYSSSEQDAIVKALSRDLHEIYEEERSSSASPRRPLRLYRLHRPEPLPALQVLIVHMIVLAMASGWNLQSILELRRSSLRDHPLPDRKIFVIAKRRGGPGTQVDAVRDEPTPAESETVSVVPATLADHFRFLCEFTAPLVAEAAPRDRDFAFLWRVSKGARKGQLERLNKTSVSNGVLGFQRRHELRNDRGQPLRLNIARMRPTMATELYRRTRDIRKVQRALHHASPQTAAMHYADKPLEAERDHAIVLDTLVSQLTRMEVDGKVLVAADGKVPEAEMRDLLSGGYNTGIARCRNPFRDGDTVCHKYFACFRCPNFCVFEDDLWRLFSFHERLLSERAKINPAQWMKTYGPIVRRIDAVIAPLFPAEKVLAARQLARERPHPTWRGS